MPISKSLSRLRHSNQKGVLVGKSPEPSWDLAHLGNYTVEWITFPQFGSAMSSTNEECLLTMCRSHLEDSDTSKKGNLHLYEDAETSLLHPLLEASLSNMLLAWSKAMKDKPGLECRCGRERYVEGILD